MTLEERRRRRFSESFRKEQVELIESGELTVIEVSRLYEVKPASIKRWLVKYGKKDIPDGIVVTSSKDYNRVVDLEKEVNRLTHLIGQQQIKLTVQNSIIELAKEKLGEDFEKKINSHY